MTSSSPETSPHTTGAHRAPRRAPRPLERRPPVRYEPYLDGLFTYCLSVLWDHDAATEALGDVLALSERQFGRSPSDAGERKAWLYALARWACLRKLTDQRGGAHAPLGGGSARPVAAGSPGHRHRSDGGSHRGGPRVAAGADARGATGRGGADLADGPGGGPAPSTSATTTSSANRPALAPDPVSVAATEERRRYELAQLAWPEAAGTTPEQREILELAVRHQLGPHEVAAVLSMEPTAARELLASAACEVERTRAALAVVETGSCPSVARLTGDPQALLSATLRRELVRHVDDCPCCRRVAERAEASAPWPGSRTTPSARTRTSPAVLPLIEAPRAAAYTAMIRAPRGRATSPRFGRNGFPMDPKDRAARRDRLRARAVTTTVVATVVAAPVLALWAAYRGGPQTGEVQAGPSISARDRPGGRAGDEARGYERYENAGSAEVRAGNGFLAGGPGGPGGDGTPDVSVEVVSAGPPPRPARPGQPAPGRLSVEARSSGGTTTLTLRAYGGAAVTWSAGTSARWVRLSASSGRLLPGGVVTVRVWVDRRYEPRGAWTARILLHPSGAVVRLDGYGGTAPPSPSSPPPSAGPSHPTDPGPGPGPSAPSPTGPPDPTPSAPTDPEPPTPTPPSPSPSATDAPPTPPPT
ncbi:hypothetical protein [Streptomyces sp. NPDC088261]|uniref:BACON domain-containing protein n=1 Tax=Streptomyces sp. NPDC088261 TaxID=3365851 RepID=UPI00382ADDC5